MTTQTGKARFQAIDPDQLSPDQKKVHEEIASGPRGSVAEPFQLLLQSPQLADRVQKLGAFVRYDALPKRYSELAILVTARNWDNDYEWYHHVPDALQAGVPKHEIEAVADRQRPKFEDMKAAVVYDFCTELQHSQSVTTETFERVIEMFGVQGAVNLVGVMGHYTLLAMLLNTFEVEPPGPTEIVLKP